MERVMYEYKSSNLTMTIRDPKPFVFDAFLQEVNSSDSLYMKTPYFIRPRITDKPKGNDITLDIVLLIFSSDLKDELPFMGVTMNVMASSTSPIDERKDLWLVTEYAYSLLKEYVTENELKDNTGKLLIMPAFIFAPDHFANVLPQF